MAPKNQRESVAAVGRMLFMACAGNLARHPSSARWTQAMASGQAGQV